MESHFRLRFGRGNMAQEIQNLAYDSEEDDNTIFITQESSVNKKAEKDNKPQFDLDIESLMNT